MLEGIRQVPWRTLRHAYGRASDTPRHIRALTSRFALRRRRAIDKLSWSIVHQGSVWQAAGYAVPFLVKLAGSPQVQDRHAILELLSDIAVGGSWHDNHRHLAIVQKVWSEAQLDALQAEQRGWLEKIAAELAASVPVMRSLLSDADVRVRMHAARLLSVIRHDPEPTVGRIKACYTAERDRLARANLLLALVSLSASDEATFLRQTFDDRQPDPLIRLIAAAGLVRAHPDAPPPDALRLLLDSLTRDDRCLEDDYNRLPVAGDGPAFLSELANCFTVAPENIRRRAAEQLVGRMEQRTGLDEQLAVFVLSMVLPKDRSTITATSLDDLQRRAIEVVARRAWPDEKSIYGNAMDILEAFGLPTRREAISALIAAGG